MRSVHPGALLTRRLVIGAIGGVLTHALVFQLLASLLTGNAVELSAMGEVDSVRARLYLWHRALDLIAGSPWLGVGPMHFAHVTSLTRGVVMEDNATHPHNIYLQVAAEYGLPASLLIFGSAFAFMARRGRALRSLAPLTDERLLTLAAWMACLGAAIDGMVSGNFVMPILQVWIALAVGIVMAGKPVLAAPAHVGHGSRALGGLLALALLCSQLWLMSVTASEWWQGHKAWDGRDRVELKGAQPQPEGLRRPRFWLNGWF